MKRTCALWLAAGVAGVGAVGGGAANGQIFVQEDCTDGGWHNYGVLGTNTVANIANWSFFGFGARAGDIIDIEVNRAQGGLDPASSVVLGNGHGIPFASVTGTTIFNWSAPGLSAVIAWGDDEDPPNLPGPYGDPHYSFTAPTTGVYTIAVSGYSSTNLNFPYGYAVRVLGSTGGACCLPDGQCVRTGRADICFNQGGVYRGSTVGCADGTCPCTIITNGGFETGNFSGWTQFGGTNNTGVNAGGTHSGTYKGYFGEIGSTSGIQRTIPVAAGSPVLLDFYYRAGGNGTNQSFAVELGGVTLVNLVNDTTHTTWSQFSIPAVAPVNNPVLRFISRNDPDFNFLDTIRVCSSSFGGAPSCYPNCDGSTVAPILNANDFVCFLTRFAAGCS